MMNQKQLNQAWRLGFKFSANTYAVVFCIGLCSQVYHQIRTLLGHSQSSSLVKPLACIYSPSGKHNSDDQLHFYLFLSTQKNVLQKTNGLSKNVKLFWCDRLLQIKTKPSLCSIQVFNRAHSNTDKQDVAINMSVCCTHICK